MIDRAATKVEIAEAKVNALELELEVVYALRVKLRPPPIWRERNNSLRKREQLIVRSYGTAAGQIAETLARLATIGSELRALNARRPNYECLYPNRGGSLREDLLDGGAARHQSDDGAFWPMRPRLQTFDEVYARS